MSQFKMLLRGSALRTVETAIGIVIGFITLPLMTNSLGGELYGLWLLIGSVSAMMYLFDIGFASAVIQKIAQAIGTKDDQRANQIISTALVIYSALALIILIVVGAVIWFYNPDLKGLITSEEFKLILLLAGLSIAIEFPAKAFAGLIQAHLRHDLVAIYQIVFKILSTTAIVILLLMGKKLLAIAIVNFIFSVLSTFTFVFVCRLVYKQMHISSRFVTRETFKDLYQYSVWAFVIDLNRILKGRMDLFFIGAYISLSAVTVYYVAVRLVDYSTTLLQKALSVTLPTLSTHLAMGRNEEFRNDLLLFNRINAYAYVLAVIFFGFFGKTLIYYWLGSSFDYEYAYIILVITVVGRLSVVAVDGYVTALYASGKHKFMLLNGISETLVTAAMLYIFLAVYDLGPIYAAIAIAVPVLLFRFMWLPFLCARVLKIESAGQLIWRSYRPTILAALAAIPIYFHSLTDPAISVEDVLVAIFIAVCLVPFLYLELMDREKQLINRLIKFNVFR